MERRDASNQALPFHRAPRVPARTSLKACAEAGLLFRDGHCDPDLRFKGFIPPPCSSLLDGLVPTFNSSIQAAGHNSGGLSDRSGSTPYLPASNTNLSLCVHDVTSFPSIDHFQRLRRMNGALT